MKSVNALVAPVVVAASAASPRCATMTASAMPTTTWVAREITMGQASPRSARSVVPIRAARAPSAGSGASIGRAGYRERAARGSAGARAGPCRARGSAAAARYSWWMARILYGVAGGMGHAIRSRVVIAHLPARTTCRWSSPAARIGT
jgi:hypothetical protein